MMNPQLELLLEIQDLNSQREELGKEESLRQMESGVFEVKLEDAIRQLEEKAGELEDRLDPAVRRRHRRLRDKDLRSVVPVIGGICYGCFMAVPTAWASESERNARIAVCQNCGRFLYHVG